MAETEIGNAPRYGKSDNAKINVYSIKKEAVLFGAQLTAHQKEQV